MIGSALLALAAGCTPYGAAAGGATPGGASPLEGTTWRLVELGGRPARPAGTDAPNLHLDGAQKRAGGNTGCNSFGGGYELNGESLRFGSLVSTKRACTDEALNAQEAAYLGALDSTRTWRITGDTLVFSGESGVVARFASQAANGAG
jgi:heat shock protein HslJ